MQIKNSVEFSIQVRRLVSNHDAGRAYAELGIVAAKGVYANDLDMMRHEFGHILQYREHGDLNYYNAIAPNSLQSAIINGYPLHNSFWTETYANYLSYNYFYRQYAMNGMDYFYWNVKEYPVQNINKTNLSRLYLTK